MLKRLESAKATTGLRKDKLHDDFNNHMIAGVPLGSMHPIESKKRSFRTPSPYDDTLSRGSGTYSKGSMMSDTSSVLSGSTLKSTGGRQRPQSAKVNQVTRPLSGKKTRPLSAKSSTTTKSDFISNRPDWEAGW